MDEKLKTELTKYLVDIIKNSSEEAYDLSIGTPEWLWVAAKKQLAEDLLLKFCVDSK